jgi:hypothetical protein
MLTAVHLAEDGTPIRWRVENSWVRFSLFLIPRKAKLIAFLLTGTRRMQQRVHCNVARMVRVRLSLPLSPPVFIPTDLRICCLSLVCFDHLLSLSPLCRNYVYQIVAPRSFVPRSLLDIYDHSEVNPLPPWDVLGTLQLLLIPQSSSC